MRGQGKGTSSRLALVVLGGVLVGWFGSVESGFCCYHDLFGGVVALCSLLDSSSGKCNYSFLFINF